MNPQPKSRIVSLLKDAYSRLGVNDPRELETRINEAFVYLRTDREHYIEVADEDVPEYRITTLNGVVCKMVPLAREIIRDQEKDHIREHTAIFSLMLSDTGNDFVISYCYARLYTDPAKNEYSCPVYRYAEPKGVQRRFRVCSPQEIRPIATDLEWEAYTMMFAAFARINQNLSINTIPHKTELAMHAYTHTVAQQLKIAGKRYSGKLVPLAWERSMWEDIRADHRYSYRKELCLLITGEKPYYVLKTNHIYRYFRKEVYDDAPGACSYEPTEEKQETTYEFVALADTSKNMSPLYY